MTAEREEVVDFVAPYFEQTGITIGKVLKYLRILLLKHSTIQDENHISFLNSCKCLKIKKIRPIYS